MPVSCLLHEYADPGTGGCHVCVTVVDGTNRLGGLLGGRRKKVEAEIEGFLVLGFLAVVIATLAVDLEQQH